MVSYQISIEKDIVQENNEYKRILNNVLDIKNQGEYLKIDAEKMQERLSYLDSQLKHGYPAINPIEITR